MPPSDLLRWRFLYIPQQKRTLMEVFNGIFHFCNRHRKGHRVRAGRWSGRLGPHQSAGGLRQRQPRREVAGHEALDA